MVTGSLKVLLNALLIMVLLVTVAGCVKLGKPAAGCQVFPASSQQKATDNKTGPAAAPTPPENQPGGGAQPPTPPVNQPWGGGLPPTPPGDQSGAGDKPPTLPSGQDTKVITQSGGVAVANWIGTWQCGQYKMYVNQSGDQVTGWYDYKDGRIKATASGNSLAGTWSESPSATGNIKLVMSPDAKSFSGDYGTGPAGSWDRHWSCTRISSARPPDPPSPSSGQSGIGVLQPGVLSPSGNQSGMGALQPAKVVSWTGTWQCGSIKTFLTQSDHVEGWTNYENGRIYGSSTGNTVTGTWSMVPATWSSPYIYGDIKLTMSLDGNSYEEQSRIGTTGDWTTTRRCTRISSDPPPGPSDSNNWSGQWLCGQFGRLKLTQDITTVRGTYTYQGGMLQGRAVGVFLVGKWSEQPTYNAPDDAGDFKLRLSDDGNSFVGEYRLGSSGTWKPWNGQRDQ